MGDLFTHSVSQASNVFQPIYCQPMARYTSNGVDAWIFIVLGVYIIGYTVLVQYLILYCHIKAC